MTNFLNEFGIFLTRGSVFNDHTKLCLHVLDDISRVLVPNECTPSLTKGVHGILVL